MALTEKSKRIGKATLGFLSITAVFSYLQYLNLDWGDFINVILNISLINIFILLVLSFILMAISTYKWQLFLVALGAKEGFWRLFKLYLIGYFVSAFLPSQIGGDIVRSLRVKDKLKRENIFLATFCERFTGIFAMSILSLVGVLFASSVSESLKDIALFFSLGIILLGTLLYFLPASFLVSLTFKRLDVEAILATRKTFFAALTLSLLFHLFTVLNTLVAALSVGWISVPWEALFVVLPMILLISSFPITPSGIGVQEGAFLFFLTQIGAAPEEALGIGLILRLKVYLLAIIGGIFFFKK
jgi:hypothetical protein